MKHSPKVANFFWPNLVNSKSKITIDKEQKNLIPHFKSLRLSKNSVVNFLNGKGRVTKAKCLNTKPFEFVILDSQVEEASTPNIDLYLSPPIGQDFAQAIKQATEVGVSSFYFFNSDYCQRPKAKKYNMEKLQQISIAAIEQCSRSHLPSIYEESSPLQKLLLQKEKSIVVADEILCSKKSIGLTYEQKLTKNIALFVGPEGGWSEQERQYIDQSQSLKLALGEHILKVPTACATSILLLRKHYLDAVEANELQ